MAKLSLADYMKESHVSQGAAGPVGPFITISRQFGCYGFSLGLLLMEILNEDVAPNQTWRIYNKEILDRLARETNLASEIIQRQRCTRPSLIAEFFQSLSPEKIPSGLEIRHRITTIIRGLACQGHAIVVGQGGAGATMDLPNGLSIRLEAPEEWRVRQIAYRLGVTDNEAKRLLDEKEQERTYLRELYASRFPGRPGFHLIYDCSVFSLAQIAQHVVAALRLKGIA